jgi:hypothetical protein
MEFFTIFLSVLLGILSPVGFGVEQVATNAIRNQLQDAETLAVRLDNTPNYQFAQGKIDRIRIAGRGLYPATDLRIAALEIETDPVQVDPTQLRQGQLELKQPLNAGVHLVLTRDDINKALRSPLIAAQLRDLSLNFLDSPQFESYALVDPQVEFLESDRIRVQVTLQSQTSDLQTAIVAESGLEIRSGRQLQLVEPTASIDGRPLPPQLINLLVGGISQRFDLANLEPAGITLRIINWSLDAEALNVAAFVRVSPDAATLKTAIQSPLKTVLETAPETSQSSN